MKPLKVLISFFIIIIILIYIHVQIELNSYLKVSNITVISDIDKDWVNDIDDILQWARKEVKNKTNYMSAYYAGWYPPKNEWVCSDVIRRALQNAGINLKELVDKDIFQNISVYPRTEWKPDSNIDFRRVPNLKIYMERNLYNFTKEVIPWNVENLQEWQPWDIVVFWKPKDHIAIISDRRNKDGVPYIIHNSAPTPREDDWLVYWATEVSPIVGHFRWKY